MQHIGLDLFSFGGKSFLICVDHWSGYPLFHIFRSLSAKSIINILTSWFNTLGWPTLIRSDRGPQFCGDFPKFCMKNNIVHEFSAPYNPARSCSVGNNVQACPLCLSKSSLLTSSLLLRPRMKLTIDLSHIMIDLKSSFLSCLRARLSFYKIQSLPHGSKKA